MMRVETISGMLYFGETFFGTEFVRILPVRALIYTKEANGYMELDNLPKEVFIPISRIEAIVELPPTEEKVKETIEGFNIPELKEVEENDSNNNTG